MLEARICVQPNFPFIILRLLNGSHIFHSPAKDLKKIEKISREDGGNISRSWRKYLEKMEEISQEDGGKGRLINVGSCPQCIVHSFGHQRLHLLQKLLKSRNLYCFAKGTHCDPNLDGTWL